jgi:beta-phosphoglucomutase-like phosphatase (HAD superfamily)
MKELIIFDFDGVLHPDTEKTIKRHLAVAKEMGLPLTQEVLVHHWGHVYVSVDSFFRIRMQNSVKIENDKFFHVLFNFVNVLIK